MTVTRIRPFLGDIVDDEDLYVAPGRRMPTLASALVVSARQQSGLTQAELAERAGVSRSAISEIERGKRDPGLEYLQRILRSAGLDLLTRLVAHDDHDEVLKAHGAGLDPEARAARSRAMQEFYAEARQAMKQSRPSIPK
jgi:transcriptional regulator with XRE-family HTH domain